MDVSVIIVNYNTRQMTVECIESVREKTYGISYEIILVDNASTDGSKEFFENYPGITYIYSTENLGFGRANNLGVSKSKGRNMLFLNPDTLLLNDAISILSNYLDENNNVAICGGNLYDVELKPTHSFRKYFPGIWWESLEFINTIVRKLSNRQTLSPEFNHIGAPIPVAYITGADLMIKRDSFEQVDGFSKEFFMYFEETDLCLRVKRLGKKIISIPAAKIQHFEGASFNHTNGINSARINRIENGRITYYCLNHTHAVIKICNFLHKTWMNLSFMITKKRQYREHIKYMKINYTDVSNRLLNKK